jgi:hypothetical protein
MCTVACGALSAQSADPGGAPSATYLERFQEVWSLQPADDQRAAVQDLVLKREGAEIALEKGNLYLLRPVGGRTMGALFRGTGRMRYAPASRIERDRLTLFRKSGDLDQPFEDLVLIFADGTIDELRSRVTFGGGRAPDGLANRVQELFDFFGDKGDHYLDPDLLRPFLNAEATGLFLAMAAGNGKPWMFMVNPHEIESVQLFTDAKRSGYTRRLEPVTQDRSQGDRAPSGGEYAERRPDVRIRKYAMDIRLPQTGTGELAFAADATLELVADSASGPWVPFHIYPKMELDSARWADGSPAEVYLNKDSPYLWVRCDRRLQKAEERTLRLAYHGDLIDRFGNWFFIKSSISWYPVAMESRFPAMFDLTFTSPEGFLLAAIGDRIDSAAAPRHMIRTRWVTPHPIRNASFNIGIFESYEVPMADVPPTTVLWSENLHRTIGQIFAQQGRSVVLGGGKNMKAQVGDDVVNALRFFQAVYGKTAVRRFYATEIPWMHGEAWPGIIGLSWATFFETSQDGSDEIFRAHEVGHQWWGISVDYATYHDRWLSEGLANFSGLWFLQARRKESKKYFNTLDRWKANVLLRRGEPLPIWLGHRVVTANTGDDYSAIVYEKGAWVMHMLRILLLDVKTMNEDRFTEAMRTFYTTYAGQRASTADFQRVLEQRLGQPMDWFFDQWVYGTGIPTYKVAWQAEQVVDNWHVKLRVDQERVPPEFRMYVPVSLDLDNNTTVRVRVKVTGARSDIQLPPVPARPKRVKFNDLEGVLAEVREVPW